MAFVSYTILNLIDIQATFVLLFLKNFFHPNLPANSLIMQCAPSKGS